MIKKLERTVNEFKYNEYLRSVGSNKMKTTELVTINEQ